MMMMERQDDDSFKVRWDVVGTVVAWLVGGLLAYGSLDARIKVLEAGSIRTGQDVSEIKSDVKELLRLTGQRP